MDAWKEVARTNENNGITACSLNTISFDPYSELIWSGHKNGQLKSLFGPGLNPYTQFVAHEGPVHQVLPHERGIFSLSSNSLRLSNRTGTIRWRLSDSDGADYRAMLYQSRTHPEIVMGGYNQKLTVVNAERGTITHQRKLPNDIFIMRRNRLLCCGSTNGEILLCDPNSFNPVNRISAHTGTISDIDTSGNLLLSCGYSLRHDSYMMDPFVKVWDLRNLSTLVPIPFPSGPSMIKMHPKLSTTAVVCSSSGQINIVDTGNPLDAKLMHIPLNSYLTQMDVSVTGDAIAFSDVEDTVHLWSATDTPSFTEMKYPVQLPDVVNEPPNVSFEEPLNKIGMPYYDSELLSSWSKYLVFDAGKPNFDSNMFLARQIANSALPLNQELKSFHRNQIINFPWLNRKTSSQETTPKFHSEKQKDIMSGKDSEETFSYFEEMEDTVSGPDSIPKFYQKPVIKYSRFGIEDFNFGFYNKTSFAGLETDITNSYCNPILQLLAYIPSFCKSAISHSLGPCGLESCLVCELGFLFAMLKESTGKNCQATNFLRCFSSSPFAQSLGIVFDEQSNVGALDSSLIQKFTKFILTEIIRVTEYEDKNGGSSFPLDYLSKSFSICEVQTHRCGICGITSRKCHSSMCMIDLEYPSQQLESIISFEWLLKLSLDHRVDLPPSWCEYCLAHQPGLLRSNVRSIPDIFFINTQIKHHDHLKLWAREGWLPKLLYLRRVNDTVQCLSARQVSLLGNDKSSVSIFGLRGVTYEIRGVDFASHFVAAVNVTDRLTTENAEDSQWYIFNDFLVKQISEEEALNVHGPWKIPAMLCYEKLDMKIPQWDDVSDFTLLYEPYFLNPVPPAMNKAVSLSTEDMLYPGMLIGIDSEFVALQREETEVRSDSTKSTIKPCKLSLARISVLRGEGPLKGVPFIDDYVATDDDVVDYLTKFSGIHPGDLDPALSKYNVVPLKVAYKKLRLLVNAGCKFVGHGLQKDFRIINLLLPPEQVIDTVDLFFLSSRQRKLSLKYLSWYLLEEDIQLTEHDSVEDALTALKLYDCYVKLKAEGKLEETLEEIYEVGKRYKYRPPSLSSLSLQDRSFYGEDSFIMG
ncbi:ubiquitin carboxy terminal hydrolase [Schizosaccharomyces octosporus yFS286]|uniref:PAN2-PAN3 deadenylation complex catalytic subunit PAN2 n=1 Tax=Schizosaccharomyces octosporus (strain yFS286) TaxID=483514 RepID=S9RKR2_SCHOY|nr:ubiquitin carboxy terminal hydrolase [Schizosaccharomyces octosporus yFS286]EPX74544.1 ubiquitin carboxy terminal hydrolase [Schizosaccharomyces octosporus yFS286]